MSRLTLLLAFALVAAGCDGPPAERSEAALRGAPATAAAGVRTPAGSLVVPGHSATELALGTSSALYSAAPVVFVAPPDDPREQARAASVAVPFGAPLLLAPPGRGAASRASTPTSPRPRRPAADKVAKEVARLRAHTLLTFGARAKAWADGLEADLRDVRVVPAPEDRSQLAQVTGCNLTSSRRIPLRGLVRAVAGLPQGREGTPLLVVDTPARASASPAPVARAETSPLPAVRAPEPRNDVLVLVPAHRPQAAAATATARAAGARVIAVDGYDPRGDAAAIAALAGRTPAAAVVAVGEEFGSPAQVRARVDVASTGAELPGGGQLIFPDRRMVALYGHPGAPALGVLGEQPVKAAVRRARRVAATYKPHSAEAVIPTFEIITTLASGTAGRDGDYSEEADLADLRPWVTAAGRAGMYVVLDLQPGRTTFLAQAKRYEQLLALPHVGLALDPEWRLRPGQRHLEQIGSVSAEEVNRVVKWLADLVAERRLPQKLLVLHQFRLSMISNRERLNTSRDELAVLIQMDGHGTPRAKLKTWRSITATPPRGTWFGWKNFYDEDTPTWRPAQTLDLRPSPRFVSYQ